jgi:large subunit ribosomal protein L28
MAMICDNCGKGSSQGITSTHRRGVAGKRWKKRAHATIRTFKPNLQSATVIVSGAPVKVKLCTRCIKKFSSEGALARQQTAHLGMHA